MSIGMRILPRRLAGALSLAAALSLSYGVGVSAKTLQAPPSEPAGALPFQLDAYQASIRSGGPGKDGIPAIDKPRFWNASEADRFLRPKDVVFGVVHNGEVRAYPQRILVWHEVVNDELGGENISITYCPLTGSTLGFFSGESSFGVSGRLLNSNVLLYDRATDTLWPQLLKAAIDGPEVGRQLQQLPVVWTTWERWKARYPKTEVLSTRTGHARDYYSDPYGSYNPLGGYYASSSRPMFPLMHDDARLPMREVVIGAYTKDGAVAFRKDALRAQKIIDVTLGNAHYVAVYDPGLDTVHVYHNPAGRTLEYASLSFHADGVRENGKPLGLEPVLAADVFWFAWAAFYPETKLHA
jgi:hypothetical protein